MKFHHDVPTLGSLLLASPDPERLEGWYGELGSFGHVPVMFDKRDEVKGSSVDPTRYILNFHTRDAKATVARLKDVGTKWVAPLEERGEGMFFATALDPDGNYVQIVQLTDEVYLQHHRPTTPFSGFSVSDIDAARSFYRDVLGLHVLDLPMGLLSINFDGGNYALAYPKPDHQPATFTILNFPVENIEEEVDKLAEWGVRFEIYEGFEQDDRNIARGGGKGPDMAWFKDPAGNILALMQI